MSIAFLVLIVLFVPLLSAAIIGLFTKRYGNLSAAISVGAVITSLLASVAVFLAPAEQAPVITLQWLDFGDLFRANIGFTVDRLSQGMMLIVTAIGTLIHIYSLVYMKDDDGKGRYFGALSLFMFSMLGIVFADNFVMMFIFWELVGVSSYLLIGHWYQNTAPPAAANKAFLANRIGDFGFMLGILLIWVTTQQLSFTGIAENLDALKANSCLAAVAALAIFCGTLGKSAQFPLHVWLPDAMEGPTPVSALIHAATMVAAGVYMLVRVFFILEVSPEALNIIAIIGAITALMAALIATQQNDIKRILAYSTLSQLGYMVMAVGLVAKEAAMGHLVTHAFFKALLFLGAGAVIYACHHEQNIWRMGGLKKLPFTALTFLIGTLALVGFPGLSGFITKDAILIAAQEKGIGFLAVGLITAFLTSFYMMRLFTVAFLGKAKSEEADHAKEVPFLMWLPLVLLAIPSVIAGYSFFLNRFQPLAEHGPSQVPIIASITAIAGLIAGFLLYRGREKDPIYIPALANKLWFDEIYAVLIRCTQDLLARFANVLDRWVIGLTVRGLAGLTWGAGFVSSRLIQFGNLQGYALLFGAGAVVLFYFVIFK